MRVLNDTSNLLEYLLALRREKIKNPHKITGRRLGAANEHWHELVIVRGHLSVICEGSCTFPGREPKGNSSGLLVSLSYLTCGKVLAMSICWTRFVIHLLATEPPSVGRHNGD
jgi:hypothetical protein